MQKLPDFEDIILIEPTARMSASVHGGRAKCLQRLVRLDMPVPRTVALSFAGVRAIGGGHAPDVARILMHFDAQPLLSVRPSSESPDWGGPGAVLNIGMCDTLYERYCASIGEAAATALYLRFIQAYAVDVARLDADAFFIPDTPDRAALSAALSAYEEEADESFPQLIEDQLAGVLTAMARAWEGTSARLLRQAKGAPADAGLGLVVQEMALGVGPGISGSGVMAFIDPRTGQRRVTGRYLSQSQGRDALRAGDDALFLTRDPRGASLEDELPDVFATLTAYGDVARARLREEMQIEFTVQSGTLSILDAIRFPRGARAGIRVAVDLAEDGIITRQDALERIDPNMLLELLHRQVAPNAERKILARAIGASPGAATGRIVFSAHEAQASAAREEPSILMRRETGPEDIRGMHAAAGIVTERGGMTSHAAVIGRGLGLPSVVGASELRISRRKRQVIFPDGTRMTEGDTITIDGTRGEILAGAPEMIEAGLDDAVQTLLAWADDARDIDVRANADTPRDARTALNFAADGIGLVRTEHMFFDPGRLTVMREMIFADQSSDRAAALERLLPMQRADFTELFQIMAGKPVCIRLLDPPLHEFLPSDKAELRDLASALDLPLSEVTERVEGLYEYNPMLGMRGVRLGITVPEIYEMQARAIFEAACQCGGVEPEIMIPLVSAKREVELICGTIESIAAAVRIETGLEFSYRIGVMVETPRAALRAGDIAIHAEFLSFGTNDLTQMTYGLSRDDAGRFMSSYVQQGVYPEDPFHRLDLDGVGELLSEGARRGRAERSDVVLSLCGEHGGDPAAIGFCRDAGFSYISCSPFRVPVARLAAAHLALADPAID